MWTNFPAFVIAIGLSLSFTARSIAAVPAAPGNVRPSWLWSPVPSNHEVMLTWDAVPEATGYNVYLWDESLQAWSAAAVGLADPRYRDAVPPAMPAQYVVTATNAEGESGPSLEAVVYEGDFDNYIIGPWPGQYPGSLTETTAWIAWYVSHVSGAEGMVDLSLNGSDYLTIYHQTNYQGGHSFWATNLTPLTIYWYRVTTISTNRVGFVLTNYFVTMDSNHPPVAESLNLSTYMAYPLAVPLHGWDSASQVPDSIESFRIIQGPTNGTLSGTLLPAWNNGAEVVYTPSQNRPVEDRFWYVANDGEFDSPPALVTITNIYYNRLPEGAYTNYTTTSGVAIPIALAGYDPDGDEVTFELDTTFPSVGVVTGPLTNLLYTPPPAFAGQDYVLYRVSDDGMVTWVYGMVVIDVVSTNIAPVAFNQSVTLPEDSPQLITLTGQDANGDGLTFQIAAAPAHGSLSGTPPLVTYTPNPNYVGTDAFSFRANDAQADSSTATVSLTVTAVNDPPVAYAGEVTTWEDTSVGLTLQANDVEGNPLTYWVAPPTNGVLFGSGPTRTFNPTPNWNGTDILRFRVHDGFVWSELVTMTIVVLPVNDPPQFVPQTLTTPEDNAVAFVPTVLEPDGDAYSISLLSAPTNGWLETIASGYLYHPNTNATGLDRIVFSVTETNNPGGVETGPPATVVGVITVNVTPVNDPPTATGSALSLPEDNYIIFGTSGSDIDGDALTHVISIPPAHGTLTPFGVSGNNWTYRPDLDYHGPDSFTFLVNDGTVNSAAASVVFTMTPVNDMPWVTNQSVVTAEDAALDITPLAGDVDGDSLTFVLFTPPAHGSVSVSGGQLTYTPSANYHGPDSFEYQAHDPTGGSNTGLISVTVTPVNDAPVAHAQSVTVSEDVVSPTITLTGSDVEGTSLSYVVVTSPAHGSLAGTPPNVVYTPTANYFGADSFTFRVNDGTVSSAVATIGITITAVNDAPSANGQSQSTPYNAPVSLTLTGSDIEGSSLAYSLLSSPANGVLSGTAPNLTFTPNIGVSGVTSFTFKVNDGSLDSAAATVTITVQPATAVPAAPSGLAAAAVSTSQINLTWTDNANNEDGCKIERSLNGSSWTQIGTVGRNVTAYSSTGLSANKTYYYRVRAYNVLGNSGYSATASAKTLK